jgi:hypothetical protein
VARVTLRGLHVSSAADVASRIGPACSGRLSSSDRAAKTLKKDYTTFTRLLNKMSPG